MRMDEFFTSEVPLLLEAEAEAIALLAEADEAWIDEHCTLADADRLELYAALLEAAARGPLTPEQQLAMEGLREGFKMVFGTIRKVGKAVAGGVKKAVEVGRKVKGEVQARTYVFTKAAKQARAAAKKVRDTKGRAAGAAVKQRSKEAFQQASRAGETHAYASTQSQKAGKKAAGRTKAAQYGINRPGRKAKPKPAAAPAPAPAAAPAPRKRKPKLVAASMGDVFANLTEWKSRTAQEYELYTASGSAMAKQSAKCATQINRAMRAAEQEILELAAKTPYNEAWWAKKLGELHKKHLQPVLDSEVCKSTGCTDTEPRFHVAQGLIDIVKGHYGIRSFTNLGDWLP